MATPKYYSFPNGIQLLDISRELNGNAAQIVQYFGRSCRLDGNNKTDDPKSDILKGIHLAIDEYLRVGGDIEDVQGLLPAQARKARSRLIYDGIEASHTLSYGEEVQYFLKGARIYGSDLDALEYAQLSYGARAPKAYLIFE